MIKYLSTIGKNKSKKDGDYFFKFLAERIFYGYAKIMSKINKVMIYLDAEKCNISMNLNDTCITIFLGTILDEIAGFAAYTKNVKEEDADRITKSLKIGEEEMSAADFVGTAKAKEYIGQLEQKYGEEFDSYLCSYLLYYLAEEIRNKNKKIVKIHKPDNIGAINNEVEKITDFNDKDIKVSKEYHVNYSVMDKILKKLLPNNQLDNIEYECS